MKQIYRNWHTPTQPKKPPSSTRGTCRHQREQERPGTLRWQRCSLSHHDTPRNSVSNIYIKSWLRIPDFVLGTGGLGLWSSQVTLASCWIHTVGDLRTRGTSLSSESCVTWSLKIIWRQTGQNRGWGACCELPSPKINMKGKAEVERENNICSDPEGFLHCVSYFICIGHVSHAEKLLLNYWIYKNCSQTKKKVLQYSHLEWILVVVFSKSLTAAKHHGAKWLWSYVHEQNTWDIDDGHKHLSGCSGLLTPMIEQAD